MPASTWGKIGVIAALFAALFWPNLRRLWLKTNPVTGEANWGHSIFVPIIGLYYLYVHREELLKAQTGQFISGSFVRPGRLWAGAAMIIAGLLGLLVPNLVHADAVQSIAGVVALAGLKALGILGVLVLALDWSVAVTLFGIGLFVYGIYPGQNDYIKDVGMIVTLFGVVLLLCGWDVMKTAWFPIVFLICAIPWPGLVYSKVAEPLQTLAAHVAVDVLKATGVDAKTVGTKICITSTTPGEQDRQLNVAEACAGMRSLMTFIAVAAAIAFLSPRPLWQKLIVTFSAIPIAIFCNVMRVSGQGLLDHYASRSLSEGFAHQFVGMMMLIPAFFLILFVGFLLDRIFIEEVDDRERSEAAVAAGASNSAMASIATTRPASVQAIPSARKPAVTARPAPVTRAPSAPVGQSHQPPGAAPVTAARPVTMPPRPAGLAPLTPPRPRTAAAPQPVARQASANRAANAGATSRPASAKPSEPKPAQSGGVLGNDASKESR